MKVVLTIFCVIRFASAATAEEERLWMNAQINGHPVKMVFDTGAAGSGVFPATVQRLDLKIDKPVPTGQPHDGKVAVGATQLVDIQIGTNKGKGRLVIWPKDLVSDNKPLDGVVGWPQVSGNLFVLEAASLTLDVLPDLPEGTSSWQKFPILTNHDVLAIQVPASGSNYSVILIDTGSSLGVSLAPARWREWTRLHPQRPKTFSAYFMPGAGDVIAEESWADELTLGSLTLTDVPVAEANLSHVSAAPSEYAATLGLGALKRMNFIVDGRHGVIYIRTRRTVPLPYEHNRLGAVFHQREDSGNEEFAHVMPHTPASEAGIRDGDVLLNVNGHDILNLNTDNFLRVLIHDWEEPPGTRFVLTIQRGAEILKPTVALRDILQPQKVCPVSPEALATEVAWFMYLGNGANVAGIYDEAINNFTEVIRLDPKKAEAFSGRGVAYWASGDHTRGWSDANEAIRLDPALAEAYYYRGVMQPDLTKAIADNSEAIRLKPDYAAAYNNRGNCYTMSDKLDLAQADFDKAIEIDPTLAQAFVRRGFVHKKRGEYDLAIKDCSEAIRVKPGDPDAFKLRGEIYQLQHKLPLAVTDFERAARLDPKDPESFNNLGTIFSEENEYARALTNLDEALRLRPGMFEPLLNRGYVRLSIGDTQGAIADETQALSLKPHQPVALKHRGNAYLALKKYAEAIADFNEAIRISPQDLGAYAGRATACQNTHDYARAVADYTIIARVETNNAEVFHNRGLACLAMGNNRKAIADFSESIRLNSNQPAVFGYRAEGYQKQRQYRRALQDYEQALELEPNNPDRFDQLATLLAVCPDRSVRDAEKAVAYARKECEITSWKSGNAIDTLALALAATGDFAEAIKREKTLLASTLADDVRKSAEKRLKLYEQKTPARERDLYTPPRDEASAHSGNTTR